MSRPYISYSFAEIQSEFNKAMKRKDFSVLSVLVDELSHRKKPKAQNLAAKIESVLERADQKQKDFDFTNDETQERVKPPPKAKKSNPKSKTVLRRTKRIVQKPAHAPTEEQQRALDAFASGGSLKINAYAGTGKTSTLQFLAHSTERRGQYIAFNRSIVKDAKDKFPDTVNCSTIHGLALKSTPKEFRTGKSKCFGLVNANQLCEIIGLKKSLTLGDGFVLSPRSQGYLIQQTVKRFAQSAELQPNNSHVPRHGALAGAPEEIVRSANEFALGYANKVWQKMCDPKDSMPLGHDGYLKLWALSKPQIAADYLLLDEAQDTNPVVLDVLNSQSAQIVYVGDRYQQIYEWRGAVNAMESISTDSTCLLTQSFRFGTGIAATASRVLRVLKEKIPLEGNPKIESRVCPTIPDAVLGRTNSSAITALIEAIESNMQAHLVGDHTEFLNLLRGVTELRHGRQTEVPEFFGFNDWNEVVAYAKSGEGEDLLTFVNLVEAKGERQLMRAILQTCKEEDADIVISTAHKSKGREWNHVRVLDDFLKSRPTAEPITRGGSAKNFDEAELRLFYVAITRAKLEVEIAPKVLEILEAKTEAIRHKPAPFAPRKKR